VNSIKINIPQLELQSGRRKAVKGILNMSKGGNSKGDMMGDKKGGDDGGVASMKGGNEDGKKMMSGGG
jgi:hypothetical protein